MSEMLIILAAALLVFGPQKLPEIAKSIAKGLKELRKAGDDLRSSVNFDLEDERPARPRAMPPPPPSAAPAAIAGSALAGGAAVHGAPAGGSPAEPSPPESVKLLGFEDEDDDPEDAITRPGHPSGPEPITDEVWPRPAEGTLARGGLASEADAPSHTPSKVPHDGQQQEGPSSGGSQQDAKDTGAAPPTPPKVG